MSSKNHHKNDLSKKLTEENLLVIVSVFLLTITVSLTYAGVSFDTTPPERFLGNLSDNDASTSNARFADGTRPKLQTSFVANGSNVYAVWFNHTEGNNCSDAKFCAIVFIKSSDNGTTFDTPKVIGNTTKQVPHAAIAVGNGGNLYIAWQNGTDILFTSSSDSGDSFNSVNGTVISGTDVDAPGGSDIVNAAHVQMVANTTGDNVYVAWTDDSHYKIVNSSDSGQTFSREASIGAVSGADNDSNTIKLALNQTHLFAFTKEGTSMEFKAAGNNGTTFTNSTIDTVPSNSLHVFPNLAANASGSEIYLVYRAGSSSSGGLLFKRSDDGTTFTPTRGLLDTSNNFGDNQPEIAIGKGGNVFIVWQHQPGDPNVINFTRSSDEGRTFSTNKTFTGFDDPKFPRIATSNGIVYLTWRENPDSVDVDKIVFVSGIRNGTSFSSTSFLTDDTTHDLNPQIAAVNDKVYVAWESHPSSITTSNGEINFTSGTGTPITITYNATDGSNFRIGEVAEITVDAEISNTTSNQDTIDVTITSPTGGGDISVELTETGGKTGIFTGTFNFTELSGSSSSDDDDILNVTAGDEITATHLTTTGTTNIFTRTVAFDSTTYFSSSEAHLTVTDNNTNTDATTFQTLTVTITGKNTGDSKTLLLNETGINKGVFGGITRSQNNLIVINSTVGEFPIGRTATITAGSATVDVTSTTDPSPVPPGGIDELTLDSIGGAQFSGKLTFSSADTSKPSRNIKVTACDTLTVDPGTNVERRFIGTCTNSSLNFILVELHKAETPLSDLITATYKGASDTADISNADNNPGGGGGGLVRPSLVLDILASLGTGAGGGGGGPAVSLSALLRSSFIAIPDEIVQVIINFDPFTPLEPFDVNAEQFETFDFPLSIDNDGYALSGYSNTLDTKTLNIGEATKIKTVFYLESKLEHVAFYTNIREGDSLDDSDAFLRFYKSEPDIIQIKDENGFFEYIDFTIEADGFKRTATFDIKFLKPMPKSDIVLRMWDQDKRSTTVIIFDAIEVVDPSIEQLEEPAPEDLEIPEPGTTIPETSELRIGEPTTDVPDWIKTSARWWNDDHITDTDFARGIEYLIENNILVVPQTETFEQEQVQEIPGWLKNNAGWWGDGLLPDQDFVNGIQWLIKNGIMKIQINS